MDGGDIIGTQIASQRRNGEGFQPMHIGEVEKNPATRHGQKRVDALDNNGDLFVESEKDLFLEYKKRAVVQSPQHKVPAGTVPESCKEPYDEQIE